MKNVLRLITIIFSLSLIACTSIETKEFFSEVAAEVAFEKKVDLGYDSKKCVSVKNKCSFEGSYTEWKQDNGKLACRCVRQK